VVERGGNKSHGAKQVYASDVITREIMELALEHFLLLSPLVHVPTRRPQRGVAAGPHGCVRLPRRAAHFISFNNNKPVIVKKN